MVEADDVRLVEILYDRDKPTAVTGKIAFNELETEFTLDLTGDEKEILERAEREVFDSVRQRVMRQVNS